MRKGGKEEEEREREGEKKKKGETGVRAGRRGDTRGLVAAERTPG